MAYRLATPADCRGIAQLIRETWGTAADEDLIAGILSRKAEPVWIATNGAELTGFCASFMTRTIDGSPRWEIDLLAVQPDARGQGIGRTLVARSSETGQERGIGFQRGLIALHNRASARCFEVNGFHAAESCELWVGPPALNDALPPPPCPHNTHLIPVETLSYRGLWIEGRYDRTALAAAQHLARIEGRDTVGAVIPDGATHEAHQIPFTAVGRYTWWILSM